MSQNITVCASVGVKEVKIHEESAKMGSEVFNLAEKGT